MRAQMSLTGGEVVFGALVVTSGDAPEVLDAVEEALDEVPLPVEPAGERKALLAVGARRDVGPGILAGGGFANGVAVVAFVGEQRRALRQSFQQGVGFVAVVGPDLRSGAGRRDDRQHQRGHGSCS